MSPSVLMRATARYAVEGWAEVSELTTLDIAKRFENAGVAAIIYTDVARDGMLQGLNLDATIAPRRRCLHSGHRIPAGLRR